MALSSMRGMSSAVMGAVRRLGIRAFKLDAEEMKASTTRSYR